MFVGDGAREGGVPGGFDKLVREALPPEHVLGLARPPRHGGHTPQADADVPHGFSGQIQSGGDGRIGEGVGFPVARFQVGRAPQCRRDRDGKARDDIARAEPREVGLRALVGGTDVQLLERQGAHAARARDLHGGVERHERLGPVARIGGGVVA